MTMTKRWSIAAAKAELSHVVRESQTQPQLIENRGEPVAVLVGIDEYRRLAERDEAAARLQRFLELSAAIRAEGGVELELPRRTPRPSPFARKRR